MAVATPVSKITAPNTTSRYDAQAFARATLAHWPPLAALLDHTLLKPEATQEQVIRLCEEAAEYRFACAMVNPAWVPSPCRCSLAGVFL